MQFYMHLTKSSGSVEVFKTRYCMVWTEFATLGIYFLVFGGGVVRKVYVM
jgi:hypothetical protein